MAIVLRNTKGSALTHTELDGNFTDLDTNKQAVLAEGAFADGDKTKLDGIEAGADVTDTANVTAAGALMDSEVTNLAAVKAFDPADYATTAQGGLADSAVQPGDDADTLGSGVAADGHVLTADGVGGAAWEAIAGGGGGTVTSVAVSGSDGIQVDSGSPVTASGTIALGVDAAALRTHLGIEAGSTADQTAQEIATAIDADATAEATLVSALGISGKASLGANTFTGTQDFNGQQVEGMKAKVVPAVSGTLTEADHSGNILVTGGAVVIPTVAGFNCVLIGGGAHGVTFNSTSPPALAAGDVMTVVVESPTVIHAIRVAAADKEAFT